MVTYNHEHLIAEAIQSVMIQKTDFDFELIIGEDCSTDNTRLICLDYQNKFPGKIKVVSREHNVGMTLNFIDIFKRAQGEFIAVLDGDDFWTDPLKLQRQIDYLELNPSVLLCGHRGKMLEPDGTFTPPPREPRVVRV